MCCHPGYRDETLVGRDCTAHDGLMQRRVDEPALLQRPEFFDAVAQAGFELSSPQEFMVAGSLMLRSLAAPFHPGRQRCAWWRCFVWFAAHAPSWIP